MERGGHDKEVASSKFNTSIQKSIPYYDQNGGKMTKIDTLFMTKTAENPTLWGRTYLYSPYMGVAPTPREFHAVTGAPRGNVIETSLDG